MTLPAGTRLGSHEIVAPIGAGGMGEVYRARDTRLGRDVALKVLPAEMAASPERLERFQREARAVAALNHPHIVTIHSVEESAGVHYLTMELVEGRSLDLLIAEGPLPVARLVEIATALADALAAAHEKGIVHRDLKPANVMVGSGGRVKVLDFGLAKVEPAGGAAPDSTELPTEMKTQEGVVMGTVPYMSPEQVQGRAVDLRTDIFSLGIILYEMATGQRPFHGHSSAELVSSILRDTPRPLTELRADCPEALARVIQRCLEKSPADRFPSAGEVRYGLRGVTSDAQPLRPSTASVSRSRAASDSGAASTDRGLWVAVLPFKHGGAEADLAVLADGLSEEIATGLSRFRYLSVVSSASAARLKGEAGDERALGARLGARYVLEGSLRKGGSAIRVSAQLVDTQTGAQLWSETYARDLQTSSMFAVQDDVAARIVATVADSYGVLVHAMRSANRQKDDVDLTPVEWQFQYFAYREQITPSAYAELKSRLERAVERDGRQSDLWACLAQIFVDEYAFGFGTDPAALDRALAAARRAVELDRANQFALVALAQTHFFRQDLAAFGPAAERAMALNPLNTDAVGILGLQIVHTGEFERGAGIVRRAMELNANHAGWMHFAPLWEHFHKGEYEQALERANRVDVPGLFWPYLVVASACGHLGRRAEAEAAVRDLLALDPEFAAHARSNVATWHFASGLMDPILEGLRKAGLAIPETGDGSDTPRPAGTVTAESRTQSGQARADQGFWVAVLPFKYGGADASLTALAEGLTEEIVTGLSRFSYLRVISRGSAADVRSAGRELGARYVMEGSLRQAGTRLRIAVQLVDASSGAHLWAETFDRPFHPETVFELQDEVVPRIVSTVADQHGILPHSMSEALRSKSDADLSPYEAVFRVFGLHERMSPQEHADVRDLLERVVRAAPKQSDCWAMLATLYSDEYMFGFNVRPDPLGRALAAAQRAVEIAPASALASQALAQSLFFRRERQAFRPVAERTIALNPMDGATRAFVGLLLACAGDWERGCAVADSAMQLNPHFPGWYRLAAIFNAYRTHDYRAAIDGALRIQMPGYFWTPFTCAAAFGQLGEQAAARKALQELLAIRPEFARTAREELGKWFEPELIEHFVEGLVKAGLEFAAGGGTAAPATVEPAPASASVGSGGVRAEEGFWVAVLPFRYSGANADLAALAEGLTGEIVTGLSRFSYLRVIARSSTSRYAEMDVRSAGRELGARYVMEGTLRQAGTRLRLAVQLVDAASGAHLWAENYERPFTPENMFALQDDLVPRIVSTVADQNGVLTRRLSEALRSKGEDALTPQEAVLRAFGYFERVTPEEHAVVRRTLERAAREAPDYADCWAMLSLMYAVEFADGFNPEPNPLDRALAAAQRAVHLAATNALGHYALAFVYFLRKETASFRATAERALALNPMDGSVMGILGVLISHAGELERGCRLVEAAMQLNPNHSGLFRFAAFTKAYGQGRYAEALELAVRIDMPNYFYANAARAAALGQLGQREAAAKELRELLRLRPDFATAARGEFEKWYDSELVEQMIDGLRKAGLDVAPAPRTGQETSGAARADEGFWVAVLPFKSSGTNASAELAALADGLSDEIVTGLSRFSYLRVIARSSTSRYADQTVDVRSAGKELGARYVMEGTLRQAGGKLRLAVQLVDAATGAHLWAESYERTFDPAAVFELQDDLVPRIVSMVAGMNGVLPRSMGEAVRSRPPEQLSPYEAVLRSFSYLERVTAEDLAAARAGLESAVKNAPAQADAWAMLALLCVQDYGQGFDLRADSLAAGSAAARRAVDAAPSNPLACFSLAQALFFQRDFPGFRHAAERAVALNSMDGNSIAFLGELLTYAGDAERGLALAERAKQLNPHHPGWYWYADFYDAYRRGDDRGARSFALKINLPGHWPSHAALAAACGQLGERDEAARAVRELLKLRPDFAARARRDVEKWWAPEYVERLIDGWRKAGLDVAAPAEGVAVAKPDAAVAIAVLPFSDMSPERDQEYLCEGMAEEVMNALVAIPGIRVASRTSAFRARHGGRGLSEIARALSVNHVLEGSVRTSGTRLRVTAQLTDVASGYQLWSERFDREAADVFAVQDEIAAGVVEAVRARLAPGARGIQPRPQVRNVEAYQHYLQGRHFRYTKNDHGSALRAYEQAVALDPSHAPSWIGLAEVSILAAFYALIPTAAAYARASHALSTASQLQGESAEALYVEGFMAFGQRHWEVWEKAQRRAIELDPSHVQVRAVYGVCLTARRRLDEAMLSIQRARELDPLAPFPHAMTGLSLLASRKVEESIRFFDDALSFDRENSLALWGSGAANVALGRYEKGIALLERAATQTRRGGFVLGILGWALAAGGRREEARAVLAELRARPEPAPAVVSEAWLLAALGDVEGAFELLARAEEERQPYLPFTGLPGFDLLRADPRFGALLDRLGLPRERKAELEITGESAADASEGVAIAVLPFSDMSSSKDQEYLCEGMAEEVMNALVAIPGIRVASRTSAFRARHGGRGLSEIARALSVNHVLEGSVRTSGTRLRVTAQLTDVASGYQLWSERFDREAADVFAVQDEIAAGVVEAVKARLAPGAPTVHARPPARNVEAYRSYLKGRHLRYAKEDYGGAIRAFEEAIRLDPTHAPSWTGLAESSAGGANIGAIPAREACAAARKALATAVELEGESADTLHAEAFVALIERRWDAMERAWRRAIDLQPAHTLALGSFGISLCIRRKPDEGFRLLERAREADPLASFPLMLTGWALLCGGRPQEARRYAEDALSFEKEDASALLCESIANIALGKFEEGIATAERLVAMSHRKAALFLGVLGWSLAVAGRQGEAQTVLQELRALPGTPHFVSEAWLLGALGETDAAFEALARAEAEYQALLYYTGLPGFDSLRGDPRFAALLERLGLAPA